jgi:nitrite reductase (NADH) small subunit
MAGSSAPGRIRVGKVAEFREGDRKLVPGAEHQIGIFLVEGQFVAYENRCLHQGGPVCEGRYFPRMTAVVAPGGQVLGERYDRSEPHLVCPWHGWEYDLRSGQFCGGGKARRLRSFTVEVEGDDVYVIVT